MKNLILNQVHQLSVPGSRIKEVILFAVVFGLVKINSVAAVFILSNLSPSIECFGSIEYALSLGIILTIPLNAGLPGAYPYFLLKLKQYNKESVFFFHGLLLCLAYFFIHLLFYAFHIFFSEILQLTLTIAAIFSLQVLASVMQKSREQVFTALIFEGGFFLLLNAYNLYLFYCGKQVALTELKELFTAYLLILNSYYLLRFIIVGKFRWKAYREVLTFGGPLIVGALLIVGLTGSARIIIERWIDLKAVGIYGLYFRLSAMVILLHQVVNIAFFKKIYTVDPRILDYWFACFLFFVGMVSCCSLWLVPVFVLPHIDIIRSTWGEYSVLFVVLNFQMFFWIVIALFENIIYREKLSAKCNPGLVLIFLVMLISLAAIHFFDQLDLVKLVGINAITLYLAAEWQLYLMNKKTMRFPKTTILLRFYFFLFSFYLITQIITQIIF